MGNNKNGCDLHSCLLCQLCLKDWLPAVAARKRNITLRKGQRIFNEGDPVAGIYFVYSGKVKVHKRWDREKELIIRFAAPGDILGHTGLGKEGIYPLSATALDPTMLCYLEMDFFHSTLEVNVSLTRHLMHFFATELQESEKRMRNLVHMPVKGRIAQALLSLRDKFGADERGNLGVVITRQDLASFAGASYETLFKVIQQFTNEKLVVISGKNMRILDDRGLKALTLESSSTDIGI